METPPRKFTRLLTALDDLVEREAIGVAARDFATVGEIQRRTAPLVAGLAELGPSAADDVARSRMAALMTRRQSSLDLLEGQIAQAREDLAWLGEGVRRVHQVAPVYGRAEGTPNRQQFRGRG